MSWAMPGSTSPCRSRTSRLVTRPPPRVLLSDHPHSRTDEMTDRLDDLIEQGLAASFARVDSCPPPQPRYLASRSATWRWRAAPALAGLPAAVGTTVVVAL